MNEFWFVVCIAETPVLFSLFLFLVLLARDGRVSFVVTSDSDKKTGENTVGRRGVGRANVVHTLNGFAVEVYFE